jgi:hypothetical protein
MGIEFLYLLNQRQIYQNMEYTEYLLMDMAITMITFLMTQQVSVSSIQKSMR